MNTAAMDACLCRLGAGRPARPTVEALRELLLRHLWTVPFENLSVHLGEEVLALYTDRFAMALDTVPTVRDSGRSA